MIALLLWILAALVIFLYRYVRYSPWKLTLQGKMMVLQKVNLILIVLFFLIASLAPPFAVETFLRDVMLILVAVSVTGMLLGLLEAQTGWSPMRMVSRGSSRRVDGEKVSRHIGEGFVDRSDIEQTASRPQRPYTGRGRK